MDMTAPYSNHAGRVVVTGFRTTAGPGDFSRHVHRDRAQLMYAARGLMHVATPAGRWILPPGRALWIAAETEHGLEVSRGADLEILYFGIDAPNLPAWEGCAVVNVSPLVRHLIEACMDMDDVYPRDTPEARRIGVLFDELSTLPKAPVSLPMPRDARAVRVAQIVAADIASRVPLRHMAREVGASERTIERLFAAETRMSFGAWRGRARMVAALERLAAGESVQATSFAIGYENPSSFIANFRATFGTTPGAYFHH
ncbi:helix-turn-helix transcriptional regulator [Sphingomonas sp. BK069]|uniref:AraC family transcriptional regulator n=1 Tax=Sphingomonas sp. BK069 TaxID=2586979 RepID=UPI001618A681|nr:helix-turn-helix transcriptional regulator [Sphingomonas sp. BK069]MBB3349717.1 AraC-like DNA-binding protein [Sphingomonas sp. BK069]